jgi:hypothetical protein
MKLGRDHEDDEQHQRDVHQWRDVDSDDGVVREIRAGHVQPSAPETLRDAGKRGASLAALSPGSA